MPAHERDPVQEFQTWFDEAVRSGCAEPEAMALATATPEGVPSVRIVLFRGVSDGGLRFFTNYRSRKGEELERDAACAAVFYWRELGRQVRFEGLAERLGAEESDAYFAARPRGHQLGAWASAQSAPLGARAELLARWQELDRDYEGRPIPRPGHWGGYRLVPRSVELWSAMPDRLHQRTRFERHENVWRATDLQP